VTSAKPNATIRVVKLGGRVQQDRSLPHALRAYISAAAGNVVVVHGGGDEVSALQRRLGHEPRFVGGRRVTTADDLEIVRMVLSGTANKRLVGALGAAGIRAAGLSGEDGRLLSARVADGAPLGRVGERISVAPGILRDLMARRWVPVVSPLACDAADPTSGLNVNGDDAAAAIAAALRADELLFIADVLGVLVGDSVRPVLGEDEARTLVGQGLAHGGMSAKLTAGFAALSAGVSRVRVGDAASLTDATRGTLLVAHAEVA
jgi:acetylglutamate kinase